MRRRVRVELARRARRRRADPERRARLQRRGAGRRGGPDHDDPRLLPPPARRPSRRRRARPALPRARRRRGRAARQRGLRRRARRAGRRATTTSSATAAGYRWRLAGIIRAAHADLRNRGARRPELPPIQIAGARAERRAGSRRPAEIERRRRRLRGAPRAARAPSASATRRSARSAPGVDFDDLQLLALELLRGSAARSPRRSASASTTCSSTSSRTRARSRSSSSARCAGPATRLFAVGDEFQSIYAFRGADLASFRRERERIAARAGSARARPSCCR